MPEVMFENLLVVSVAEFAPFLIEVSLPIS